MAKKEAKAIKFVTPSYGLAIYDIEYAGDTYVIWGIETDKGPTGKSRRSKIYYTKTSDRAYFKNNGRREYLDEFMSVGRY